MWIPFFSGRNTCVVGSMMVTGQNRKRWNAWANYSVHLLSKVSPVNLQMKYDKLYPLWPYSYGVEEYNEPHRRVFIGHVWFHRTDIAAHHLSVAYETGVVASLEQAKSECVDWISKQGV